ncbi:MAG: glycoside hydrolase family 76 protein [Dysgonomonas sp.]
MRFIYVFMFVVATFFSCSTSKKISQALPNRNYERAQLTQDSLYKYYSVAGSKLLRETYPFDEGHRATYLASEEHTNVPNRYSYLWPFSGTFSSANVLFELTKSSQYKNQIDTLILPGLEEYFDTKRSPAGYASYINTASVSDRFYDDNVWIGIDFTDIYKQTFDTKYLDKAKLVWNFVISGMDDKLGGGIYWCEQKKHSKNTCSNAPGSVFALKMFEVTKDSMYFYQGKQLYEWTEHHLQDTTDHLYFDNINLQGKVGTAKYAYNSGQMMQASALLYKLTGEVKYLKEAQILAASCYDYFFTDFVLAQGTSFKLLKRGDLWFIAVMLRGFAELYEIDGNDTYIRAFQNNMDYAWGHTRDEQGLFSVDFSGKENDNSKWLLSQAAMIEMYARLALIDKKKKLDN